ncbi:MAG: PEP-utilizing enzyme, partial [Planctomycetota bacterium]
RPDLDAAALMRHERERRAEAEREMRGRLGGFAWRRLAHSLRNARQGIKARERMRLARTRLFGLFRDVYLAIGARLHAAGRLDSARDVFWLTTDELQEFCEGRATTTNLAALAAVRRAEFAAFESREMPDRFDTVGPAGFAQFVRPAREAADTSAATLRGTGCSAGVVEAELAVILRPDDDLAINGRILTTVRTDPGWAPLFPSAAGELIARGSTLSHSAVLARELGIPAVVGVQNLLKIVRQGERVRLDGATGIVQRLDAAVGQ